MRTAARLVACLLLCVSVPFAYVLLDKEPPPQRERPVQRAAQEAEFGPEDTSVEQQWLARRLWRGRRLGRRAYDRARDQMRLLPRVIAEGARRGPSAPGLAGVSSVVGTVWKPLGPSPIVQGTSRVNGRVSALAISPNNANVIYVGASGGGVWRSTDGGANWTPLLDREVAMGLGEPSAIAIDPADTNTVYVGTSSRFVLNTTKGILKSTDGGSSWIVLGSNYPDGNMGNADTLFANASINSIIVDPANSNVLYLSASNGLFRSIDAGRNWTVGTLGGGDARSLVMDATSPANARILYAGVNGSGVRQSTNGGQNWTQILNAATPAVNTALAGGGFGHVVVALAPPTAPANAAGIQVLYVTMAGGSPAPDPVGIFRSTDQGVNWAQAPATGLGSNTQGGYDLTLGVDPESPGDGAGDIVYVGMVGQFRSTDAGNNFASTSNGQHVDTHAAWTFVPQPGPSPSIVYTGNDGGLWRSLDGGATWTGTGLPGAPATINAGSIQTALFYNMDVKRDATASVSEGSTQDNGTPRTGGGLSWTDTQGGDGWDIAFDPVNTDNAYISSGFWSPAPCTRVWRSTDSGATWPFGAEVTPWGTTTDQGCYLAPVESDPTAGDTIYVGGNQNVWQTQDGGSNWRIIVNLGTADIDVARGNSNIVVVSTGFQVWVSSNALATTVGPPSGVTFTNITRNLPGRFVTRVAVDPVDPTVIYAVLSGFDTQTPVSPGHVFRTTIAGTAWTNISPAVDAPVNAIALDGQGLPPTLYVGTDLGVLRSVNGGASWAALDDVHLPNVPVTDLVINETAGVLRASSFGRGAFELAPASGPVVAVNAESGLDFGAACAGEPQFRTLSVFNVGTANLTVHSVHRLFGSADFTVLAAPATPLVISPDAHVDFTVRFAPSGVGPRTATIRITTSDPAAPQVDLTATAVGARPSIDTVIADAGSFGSVCRGAFKDLDLTVNNSGSCPLSISGISSSAAEFQNASVLSYPVVVGAGDSLAVPIRLAPTTLGAKAGVITVSSNDPDFPTRTVSVSGNTPAGDLRVTGTTDFGGVCAGTMATRTVPVCNVGACNLSVVSAVFSPPCADFTLVNNPFPAPVSPDSCQDLTILFTPTSTGPKACTLVVTTDDPDQPVIVLPVTANTPGASIDVPPDLGFPPTVIQSVGACSSARAFPVSNTGTCNLTITNFAITNNAAEFSLDALPSFPIILQPGHVAGDGALAAVFEPDVLDRDRTGALTVTYVSDPVSGATASVTRALCGEGVRTGARVLVKAGGVALPMVKSIKLHRINANRNRDMLDTVDQASNLPLRAVTPAAPCQPFEYHREYATVSNPIQLAPGSYQVTVTAVVDGHQVRKVVGFDVNTCGFNPNIVIDF